MKYSRSAGLAIIYKGMLLMGHPSNGSWVGRYSIPKGHVEDSESILEAAIRETKEEVGISVPLEMIDKTRYKVYRIGKHSIKTVFYYIVKIDDLGQIGLDTIKVPKEQLQIEEIDWAGFITYKEAKLRSSRYQLALIDNLLNLGLLNPTL